MNIFCFKKEQVFTGFELIGLGRLDYKKMLSSQVPEAVVLAVLGDFGKEPAEDVIRSIVEPAKNAKSKFLLSAAGKRAFLPKRSPSWQTCRWSA